jgi:acetoin utilization protein AcuB
MSRPVVTVTDEDTALTALKRLKEKNLQSLPVLKAGRVVGLLSEADLYRASAKGDIYLAQGGLPAEITSKPVKTLMRPAPLTVAEDYTIEEAADLMFKNRINTLPVTDSRGWPVGVITRTDILKVMITLTGVARKGIQYAMQIEDRPEAIQEITDTIRSFGGRMASILTAREGAPAGYRKVFIRIYGIDRFKLSALKEALSKKAELIYVQEKPEIRRETHSKEYPQK